MSEMNTARLSGILRWCDVRKKAEGIEREYWCRTGWGLDRITRCEGKLRSNVAELVFGAGDRGVLNESVGNVGWGAVGES